jgi:hypothetical protein
LFPFFLGSDFETLALDYDFVFNFGSTFFVYFFGAFFDDLVFFLLLFYLALVYFVLLFTFFSDLLFSACFDY